MEAHTLCLCLAFGLLAGMGEKQDAKPKQAFVLTFSGFYILICSIYHFGICLLGRLASDFSLTLKAQRGVTALPYLIL